MGDCLGTLSDAVSTRVGNGLGTLSDAVSTRVGDGLGTLQMLLVLVRWTAIYLAHRAGIIYLATGLGIIHLAHRAGDHLLSPQGWGSFT